MGRLARSTGPQCSEDAARGPVDPSEEAGRDSGARMARRSELRSTKLGTSYFWILLFPWAAYINDTSFFIINDRPDSIRIRSAIDNDPIR